MEKKEESFVKVLETSSLTDIAMIKSTLDAYGLEYVIQGENMQFIRPGGHPAVLLVAEHDVEKVFELLKPLKLSYQRIVFG